MGETECTRLSSVRWERGLESLTLDTSTSPRGRIDRFSNRVLETFPGVPEYVNSKCDTCVSRRQVKAGVTPLEFATDARPDGVPLSVAPRPPGARGGARRGVFCASLLVSTFELGHESQVSGRFRSLVETYDVNFDRFVRTTEEERGAPAPWDSRILSLAWNKFNSGLPLPFAARRHAKVVDKMWALLEERGQIYLGAYEGWYCVRDECYYTEGELVDGKVTQFSRKAQKASFDGKRTPEAKGSRAAYASGNGRPRCVPRQAPTGADVEWREKEASYFFRLSQWREREAASTEREREPLSRSSRGLALNPFEALWQGLDRALHERRERVGAAVAS